jgi:DNA polymerase-1
MTIAGFGFDAPRAREMAVVLEQEEAAASLRLAEAVGRPVNALSNPDLKNAFFSKRSEGGLGAPVVARSELTEGPSLGVDAMRVYIASGNDQLRAAALAVLDVRKCRKVKSTYILRPLSQLSPAGRIHPTWNNCKPVTGRWSCQDPNLQNLVTPSKEPDSVRALGGIRGLYIAAPGHTLVGFDCSQLEMRIAAYASGDEAMIGACESSDLHAGNAKVIFGQAFNFENYIQLKRNKHRSPEEQAMFTVLEGLRNLAKSSGFAVCYMAEAETVFARIVADGKGHLLPHGIRTVETMLHKLQRGFRTYFAWQEKRLLDCIREGWTNEPITGRRRWLGHDPKPTECANFPIQGGAAGLMNTKLPAMAALVRRRAPAARLIAQVHDYGGFECPLEDADTVEECIKEVAAQPVYLHSSQRSAIFPIDMKKGERWS